MLKVWSITVVSNDTPGHCMERAVSKTTKVLAGEGTILIVLTILITDKTKNANLMASKFEASAKLGN